MMGINMIFNPGGGAIKVDLHIKKKKIDAMRGDGVLICGLNPVHHLVEVYCTNKNASLFL